MKQEATLGSNTCDDQHGNILLIDLLGCLCTNILILRFIFFFFGTFHNDLTILLLHSTINYGSELPLAQGINFG